MEESSVKKQNIFWLEQPTVLFKDGNYLNFLPTLSMTRVEQMNSLTRLFIYYLAILIILGKHNKNIYLPIIGIVFIVILYYIYTFDPDGKMKELYKQRVTEIEGLENVNNPGADTEIDPNSDYFLESGYYDSNGDLVLGREYKKRKEVPKVNYKYNELLEYQKAVSRKPTRENPFMNPPVTDFNDGDKPVAANADDEDINEDIKVKFNQDLYRNIDDLFQVKNSERQFYTIPATAIPPDQTAFAEWLYKPNETCKTTQDLCLRYEDLRYKR